MGCIIEIDFQQPNPLIFSALIVFLILLKLGSQQTALIKSFYSSAQIALGIIFCISLLGVICATPCEYPCDIYHDLKGKDEFYIFIAWQAIVKAVLILMAIRLCQFIFLDGDDEEETPEIEPDNFFMDFIFSSVGVALLVIFLLMASQLSVLFEFSLTADNSTFSYTSTGTNLLELYKDMKTFYFDYMNSHD
jgi:hypothetical protein